MFNGRRVGTLTLGIVLIAFGLLFISRLLFNSISYDFIFTLWPFILISLGIETILAYIINRENKIKYDGGAITLIVILTFFVMGMAGAEFFIKHMDEFRCIQIN